MLVDFPIRRSELAAQFVAILFVGLLVDLLVAMLGLEFDELLQELWSNCYGVIVQQESISKTLAVKKLFACTFRSVRARAPWYDCRQSQ